MYGATEEDVKQLSHPYEKIRDAYRVAVPNTETATQLIVKYPKMFTDYEITKVKMDDVVLSVTGKTLGTESSDSEEREGKKK